MLKDPTSENVYESIFLMIQQTPNITLIMYTSKIDF